MYSTREWNGIEAADEALDQWVGEEWLSAKRGKGMESIGEMDEAEKAVLLDKLLAQVATFKDLPGSAAPAMLKEMVRIIEAEMEKYHNARQ